MSREIIERNKRSLSGLCDVIGFCGSSCGKRRNHQGEHHCGICGRRWKRKAQAKKQ